jgi:hypothetical protein
MITGRSRGRATRSRGNDARTPAHSRLERLTHAYGAAADVPGLLRALAADDRQARKDAYWELYGNIFHQGTRYPATAPAMPFLLELLADPGTPDRHELLLLLTHLVTGQFSVAADPVMYAGEQDDVRRAAVTTTPRSSATSTAPPSSASRSTSSLVQHAETAHVRAPPASCSPACGPTPRPIVPVLRARLAHETQRPGAGQPRLRARSPAGRRRTRPRLARACTTADPAPLVRLSPPSAWSAPPPATLPDAVVATLIAAVHDPDAVPGYDDLPCGERDLAGDIGYVLRSLPPALGRRALPALCAALGRAEDFGTMGLVEAMLAFAFGEPPVPQDSRLTALRG